MCYINPIAKWNIEEKKWNYCVSYEEIGRSYSFINYNDNLEATNYLIFAPGVRLENATTKTKKIKVNYLSMDNIVKHFNQKHDNYNIKLHLMDADAPIIEEAKILAKYIDRISSNQNTKSITIVGYSKCGVMNTYIPSYFENEDSFKKTNIINAATPYKGTIMASNELIFKKFYSKLLNILKNKEITNFTFQQFKKIYEKTSSNSHMDYDISLPDGISIDKRHLYDKNLIKNIFREENIESLKRIKSFTNITTGINEQTKKEAIKDFNIENLELYIMNKYVLDDKTDGIVPIDSQLEIEKYLDIKSKNINACTHNIHTNKRCLKELLDIIDDTITKPYIKK